MWQRAQKKNCLFCAEVTAWGYSKLLPINKFQEEGLLENNELIIKVEVKVVDIVHEGKIRTVSWMFVDHPYVTKDFRIKNKLVKTAYMNVLLGLISTLNKPPRSLLESELRNAQSELSELTEAGFNLDWLKTKLEEVSLERKNAVSDGSQVKELEEHVKNLKFELELEKTKSSNAFAKVSTLEKTVSDLRLELDKERLVKSVTSKVASLKDAAVCFWNTTNLGIRQKMETYQNVD